MFATATPGSRPNTTDQQSEVTSHRRMFVLHIMIASLAPDERLIRHPFDKQGGYSFG
jgi:hypothetical protein